MLLYKQNNQCFVARAGAVILSDDRILLNRVESSEQEIWLLPGGRVEFGEASRISVLREISEELGLIAKIERLLWVVEDFYKDKEVTCHEVFWVYKLAINENESIYSVANYKPIHTSSGDVFQWIPLVNIGNVDLVPPFLKKALKNLPDQTESKVEMRI